ncbi:MAG: sugar transferase [Fibrobacterota bacterium]|nr:MAG: sugar transferase [Fibrobacterota bacterium]
MSQSKQILAGIWETVEEESAESQDWVYAALKRALDLFGSVLGLLLLSPLFLVAAVAIKLDSRGAVFFRQERVGKGCKTFRIFKFRSMSESKGSTLTIGDRDPRVTKVGFYLRKTKIDELPQLINVLLGDMSLVGPRPEALGFINLNDPRQRQVFSVLPGMTAPSSLALMDLSDELAREANPVEVYRKKIIPMKIEMNLGYIEKRGIGLDLALILATVVKLVK